MSELSKLEKKEIVKLYCDGMTIRDLVKKYKISSGYITQLLLNYKFGKIEVE